MELFNGNINEFKELVLSGVDVNIKDKYGDTSLIISSRHGFSDIVKELLISGADVNIKNISSLMLASHYGYSEIVKELLLNNADVNLTDNYGDSSLMRSSYKGFIM